MATILMTIAEKKTPSKYDIAINLLTFGRRGIICRYIEESYIKENSLVLDAGTGSGIFLKHITRAWGRPIGVDINPRLLEIAKNMEKIERHHYELIESSILSLPFRAKVFDVLVCNFVLSELSERDLKNTLSNYLYCLNNDGLLILTVENKPKGNIGNLIYSIVRSTSYIIAKALTGTPRHPIHNIEAHLYESNVSLIEKREYLFGTIRLYVFKKREA